MTVHTELTPAEAADRLALRELFDAYAHCADRRDAEGQKALFTEDTGWTCNGTGTHVKPVRAFQDVRPAAVGSAAVHEPRWCARGRGGGPG
jgi:hypothetical protein